MLSSLLTLPSRPRLKWVFLIAWLASMFAIGAAKLPEKFDEAQSNESSSFLPGDAESTKALAAAEEIQGGELAPIVVVYSREAGLTGEDKQRIVSDRDALNEDLPPRTSPYEGPVISKDGTTALLQAQVKTNGEGDTIIDPVEAARDQLEKSAQPGVETAVTGGAGFSADAIKVFDNINGTLLLTTAAIVFLLLLIVYRSPIFWFFPLLAVGFAELTARAIGFGLTEIGVTVTGPSAGILPVLVFGAGTDYALLLISRYRDELRREESRYVAMAAALRRTSEAVLASATTVVLGLLTLPRSRGPPGSGRSARSGSRSRCSRC